MKYIIPSTAPSSVQARTNNIPIPMYGKIAKKYEALPELRTPLINIINTHPHEASKHKTSFQSS